MDGFCRRLQGCFRAFAKAPKPRLPAQNRRRARRPLPVETLEERLLPSATSAAAASAAAVSALGKLADPTVQQMAQADYAAHQSITRNDLLSIFTEIEQDHVVSANEFSSLKSLVADASTVAMPGYVAQLASKVVNGDPANIYLASTASPTGNLLVGSPAAQLKALVSDWFNGQGPIGMTNSSVKLSWVGDPLYTKAGPQASDVAQGVIGDCTLLASLAEVAIRQPAIIESMFINNGDGTYTVRLYHNGAPNYVTVDTQLPNAGQLYDRISTGVLWPALAEKAIVEENASGWLATLEPGSDSYAALNGGDEGTAQAYLSTITGLSSSAFAINPTQIAADWNAGKFVVLATGSVPSGINLVTDHCYALAGYNSASSTPFTLFNPWGIQAGEPTISASTLLSSFQFGAAGSALEQPGHIPPLARGLTLPDGGPSVSQATVVPPSSASLANTRPPSVADDLSARSTRAVDQFFASLGDPLAASWELAPA